MSEPSVDALLESIAEALVMEDLGQAKAREKIAQTLHAVADAIAAELPRAADESRKLEALCLKKKLEAGLSETIERHLSSLRREILKGSAKPATAEAAPQESPAPEAAAPEVVYALPEECDPELLREFLVEAHEHLDTADAQLLTLEQNSRNDEALNTVFRAFHTLKGVAGFLGLVEIQRVAHESENLLEKARRGALELTGPAIDVTFEAVDTLKKLVQNVECLQKGTKPSHAPDLKGLLTRLDAAQKNPDLAPPAAAPAPIPVSTSAPVPERAPTPIVPVPSASIPAASEAPAPEHPDLPEERAAKAPAGVEAAQTREVLKVDAERLDRLVDMIGELVIAESMVSQSEEMRGASTGFTRHLSQLDKITRELQEIGTSLRMIPIRATFQKMARLVRDLAKKSGKQVEFAMTGEDTELDRTVVEKIGDPLIHMIRNSVDHGIEKDPADRTRLGKPSAGRVELKAYHRGGNIHIEICDDGRGLNKEAILAKGRERGLVKENEVLSDREIFNLIFAPGLSTAKEITDVSGRGVGMDVVKRNIEALRGQIDIQSQPGKGTTFCIRLPLTLAIIDGMIVRVGTERYVIPTLSIVRSVRPLPREVETVLGRGEMLKLQERLIPVFRLHEVFHIDGAEKDLTKGLVVVVEDGGRRAGILADELLGQQQIVIKTLGESMREQPGLSGGAIMPDGNVGLILDVCGLVRLVHSTEWAPAAKQELQAIA